MTLSGVYHVQVVAGGRFLRANDLGDHIVGTSDNKDDTYTTLCFLPVFNSFRADSYRIKVGGLCTSLRPT